MSETQKEYARDCLLHKHMKEERCCKVKTQGRTVQFGCRKKNVPKVTSWSGLVQFACRKKRELYRKLQLKVGRYNLPVSPRLPPPVLPLQMELLGTQAGISKIFRYWQTKVESGTNWRDFNIWHLICSAVSSSYCPPDWMRSCTGGKCGDCRQATPAALSSLCTTLLLQSSTN